MDLRKNGISCGKKKKPCVTSRTFFRACMPELEPPLCDKLVDEEKSVASDTLTNGALTCGSCGLRIGPVPCFPEVIPTWNPKVDSEPDVWFTEQEVVVDVALSAEALTSFFVLNQWSPSQLRDGVLGPECLGGMMEYLMDDPLLSIDYDRPSDLVIDLPTFEVVTDLQKSYGLKRKRQPIPTSAAPSSLDTGRAAAVIQALRGYYEIGTVLTTAQIHIWRKLDLPRHFIVQRILALLPMVPKRSRTCCRFRIRHASSQGLIFDIHEFIDGHEDANGHPVRSGPAEMILQGGICPIERVVFQSIVGIGDSSFCSCMTRVTARCGMNYNDFQDFAQATGLEVNPGRQFNKSVKYGPVKMVCQMTCRKILKDSSMSMSRFFIQEVNSVRNGGYSSEQFMSQINLMAQQQPHVFEELYPDSESHIGLSSSPKEVQGKWFGITVLLFVTGLICFFFG